MIAILQEPSRRRTQWGAVSVLDDKLCAANPLLLIDRHQSKAQRGVIKPVVRLILFGPAIAL